MQATGKVSPIVPELEAAGRAQAAARALGLRRLNSGQEGAARLILSSEDRVVSVQGGPGRGKSAALAPVVAIAKEESRRVIGLAVAKGTAKRLGDATGAETLTLARFLGQHAQVIDGTATSHKADAARQALGGAVLILDESSQVGTVQMERLVRLANVVGVGRLALVGDRRQLGAVEAGKPAEQIQDAGNATAHLTENLRSKSDQMKELTRALDGEDWTTAFDVLRPTTIDVQAGNQAETAARRWAALPAPERDKTLLIVSGRVMRTATNEAAQAELKRAGVIASSGVRFDILDRSTVTRENTREMRFYNEGRVVEFRTNLPSQGFTRGEIGEVVRSGKAGVRLQMRSGGERTFRPDKLPRNLKHDAVSVYGVKRIELHAGDRIRWSGTDHERGLLNADLARVEEVGPGRLTVSSLSDGQVHDLGRGDPMLERLDLAYAVNAHVAQGVTAEAGIVVMSAAERGLNTARLFLVALTRMTSGLTLVVDDTARLERMVASNPGDKTSALEVAGGARDSITLHRRTGAESAAVARYLQAYQSVERMLDQNLPPLPGEEAHLDRLGAALDRLRPDAAEDLRAALDRDPTLRVDKEGAGMDRVLAALAEEQRLRENPAARADRFVADWQRVDADQARAGEGAGSMKAEWRMDALADRMDRTPKLQAALDRALPDRQHRIEGLRLPPLPERSLGLDL